MDGNQGISGFTFLKGSNCILFGSRRLQDEATVFQAELMVIKMAMLTLAGQLQDIDRYVKRFSDSRAAIQALNGDIITCQWAQRLINLEIPVLVRSLKSSNVELG